MLHASAANLYRMSLPKNTIAEMSTVEERAAQYATCDLFLNYQEQGWADLNLYGWPKDSDGTNNGLKPILQKNLGTNNLTSYTSKSLGSDRARIIFYFLQKDANGNPIRTPSPQIETSVTTYSGSAKIPLHCEFPGV
ncbi:MAG: hypothetical protein M1835_002123 [Candelina submexicana]|nr:MAG: hypothetical protein M1835_002123 [Candelina submexicana]